MTTYTLRDLQFLIDRCIRYHQRRSSFYNRCHKLTLAVSLLSMTAMFGGELGEGYAGAIVVVLLLADFVVGFSAKSDLHSSIARLYVNLQRKALKAVGEEKASKIQDEMFEISASEPPAYMALEADCCNQALWARDGKTEKSFQEERIIGTRHRLTMHLLRYSGTDFPCRKELASKKQETASEPPPTPSSSPAAAAE